MCGIAGFTASSKQPEHEGIIESMVMAIRHRGPDAQAWSCHEGISLGHARLSIIDLSDAGTQPMHSACGRYSIAFNGEIYNFLELRDDLEKRGYRFQTKTDTEVILALFMFEGPQAVTKLNGMYAIAFADHKTGTLDLLRDRIGKKPLYYTEIGGQLVFASELKSLLQFPGIEKEIREDALYDFFAYQYVPDPKTIFNNIHKLSPASHLHREADGQWNIRRYWEPRFGHTAQTPYRDAKDQLLETIKDATEQRMISDVPLGAFLSGGVDSSGIVALMAEGGETVTTCTIGFDDKKYNEADFAKVVADQYKTNHKVHMVNQDVASRLNEITYYFDEPFADPSLVPTFFVSELAKQDVTVALTGDGGDEIFAGYSKYAVDWHENRLRAKFPSFTRSAMGSLAPYLRKVPNTAFRKASSLMNSLNLDPAKAFFVTNSFLDEHVWQAIATPDLQNSLGSYHPSELTEETYHRCDGPDHLSKILYTDMNTFLPGGILVKADRMSMAHALELRAPLLDYRVIELANTFVSDFKFDQGNKKKILKDTFEPLLPHDILHRKKMGFSTPLAHWLRTELKTLTEGYLFNANAGLAHYFDQDALKALWTDHQKSRFDHSSFLWSMLMFEMWWQHYMADQPETNTPESEQSHEPLNAAEGVA